MSFSDEIHQSIRAHITDELEPARQRGKYICPICGSGKGPNGTAAFSIDKDGIHGRCFARCNFYGDIFDLCSRRDGISLQEAERRLMDKYCPNGVPATPAASKKGVAKPAKPTVAVLSSSDIQRQAEAYKAVLMGSDGEAYLRGRGLTADTMEHFSLGYDAKNQRVTIPYNEQLTYYDTRAVSDTSQVRHKNLDGITMPLFNPSALYTGMPCFVVESPLCAISIEQEGGCAVAISGTSGKNRLKKQVEQKRPSEKLILSLDNDEAGRKAQSDIAAMLQEMEIPFLEANVAGTAKDPNELLQRDPLALRANIAGVYEQIRSAAAQNEAERLAKYEEGNAGNAIDAFFADIERDKNSPAISTGFPELDKLLDGGLYAGLYIVGAVTSLGKTTFTLQIADNIAAAGQDVLFFSLEMAQRELIAKSLSRLTFELSQDKSRAKTTLGILSGRRWANYSREEMQLLAQSADQYKDGPGRHIWFHEGIGNIGVEQIREQVDAHIRSTGRKPVVVIDYLQILAPSDPRASDKQNTDKAVLELKRLSRDKGIPVFGISSLNRDNYLNPINNAAFKESGAIEYSSDILIGLQFSGMDYQDGEADKAREKRIRELIKRQQDRGNQGDAEEIELKILKFRNGRKGTSLQLHYFPWFNFYRENVGFISADGDKTPFDGRMRARRI